MNKKLKICHIVNWYPNKWDKKEAIWTKRHIDGLNSLCDNDVYHVQVKFGKWKKHFYRISDTEQAFILTAKTNIWFLREILTTLLLCYVILFKIKNRKQYDAYNFQIAYPLLTYSKLIVWLLKKTVIVTEHWSAYHLNFGTTKNLKRIKRIFKNKKLNFICVSDALRQDIENFSGKKISYKIVSNTIDSSIFKNINYQRKKNSFFMLSFWKVPKNPFMLFDVFSRLKKENFSFELVVGGFGPLEDKMKQYIDELDMTKNVAFIGKLDSNEIVDEMNKAQYFIHNSNYEVSSVVCMEAISCGTPVIASKVGGIPEYLNNQNGILIENNSFENWYLNIKNSLLIDYHYNNQLISEYGYNKFSSNKVAQEYFNAINYFIIPKNQ